MSEVCVCSVKTQDRTHLLSRLRGLACCATPMRVPADEAAEQERRLAASRVELMLQPEEQGVGPVGCGEFASITCAVRVAAD
ncbi:hypothetical protein B0H13DRAFT_2363895 [Mycena leptocephala]|nr:hypothetical protein B0H13DRAFT_2363895 [Mycena leptocephala]